MFRNTTGGPGGEQAGGLSTVWRIFLFLLLGILLLAGATAGLTFFNLARPQSPAVAATPQRTPAPSAVVTSTAVIPQTGNTPSSATITPSLTASPTSSPTASATTALTGTPTQPSTFTFTATPQPAATTTSTLTSTATDVPFETLIAVGDIATCRYENDEAVAALVKELPGTVALLGDIAYEDGSERQFRDCFDPAWGELKNRLKPVPGNHEYHTRDAKGYFNYFGDVSGLLGEGYYSYDVGGWHIVALNSNCDEINGGCQAGSAQDLWLRADLATHPSQCTLAYWHHPRFSSGQHGNDPGMEPLWQALYDYGADVVLNGHDHNYERFGLQDSQGKADAAKGIREFVVGTGGRGLRPVQLRKPNSEVRSSSSFGVLQLTLYPDRYEWKFVGVPGGEFTDQGSDTCR